MQPEERDAAYLWDMLEAAKNIVEFTQTTSFAQYLGDKKLQLAVERSLEIIGEAAKNLSEKYRNTRTEIPWRKIIGQRNVLIHEYGEIKQERIWELVRTHIPDLIMKLEKSIPPSLG